MLLTSIFNQVGVKGIGRYPISETTKKWTKYMKWHAKHYISVNNKKITPKNKK